MSLFLRTVPTASGATAVQIVSKLGGKRMILEHVGSAHTTDELAALIVAGRQRMAEITETQLELDLGIERPEESILVEADRQVVGSASRLLVDTIRSCYQHLDFGEQVGDEAFFLMVLLNDHLKHCVLDAAKRSDEAAYEKIQEVTAAVNRLIRS